MLVAIERLAGREFQERVWIRRELPHPNYCGDLDLVVHTLFDDSPVLPDPASAVGEILHLDEVEPLLGLSSVFKPLIDDLGDESDAVYLADPRWDDVVRAAATAWKVMRAHETRSRPAARPWRG